MKTTYAWLKRGGDKELRISVKESAWKVFSTQTDIETFAHSIAMTSNLVLKT
jgi:hypothetical protein